MDQDATWYIGRPRPYAGHIVLDGAQPPLPPKKGEGHGPLPTIFVPCLLWPNGRQSQLLHAEHLFRQPPMFVGSLLQFA